MEIFVDKFYLAALAAIVPGLGKAHILEAIKKIGSAQAIYEATGATLKNLSLFSENAINNFLQNRNKYNPINLQQLCEGKGIQVLSYFDDAYPSSLKEIHNPPLVLYVMGNLPKDGYHIGIVGSRRATPYGLKAARYFAKAMVAGGITVISGGAAGIDSASHAAALEDDGKTIAVLGCGVDIIYPAENKALFQGILKKGALVSEYPPGTHAQPRFFPARNRIIVGLSRGIIVCEAAAKSGALITAHCAVDEQREVYCVPGNIFEPTSTGCHNMIKEGAQIIDDARQIFKDRDEYFLKFNRNNEENLFIEKNPNSQVIVPSKLQKDDQLDNISPLGKKLFELLSQGAMGLDVLVEKSGEDLATISTELLDLQVIGLIATDQTQKYYKL